MNEIITILCGLPHGRIMKDFKILIVCVH